MDNGQDGQTAGEASLLGGDPQGQPSSGQQPPAAAQGFVSPDGALSDGWTNSLPEDAAPYKETLSRYKSVPELAKALANANGLIGKKLGVPNEKSSPEEVAAYRKALGMPDKLEDYNFKPEGAPDEFWDSEAMKPFAEAAFKHNVPPGAMKELAGLFAQYENSRADVAQGLYNKQRDEAIGSLKKEWGAEFDKNIAVAKQAAKLAGVNSTSFGFADPEVVRGYVRLAQMMSEDKIGRGAASPDMMGGKARANDIMRNPENAWHKRYQEGDPEAVALVTGLLKQG